MTNDIPENMTQWKNGFDMGYASGYESGYQRGKLESSLQPSPVPIIDPGPTIPDGLSYEEIYGSVVYHQGSRTNKKG